MPVRRFPLIVMTLVIAGSAVLARHCVSRRRKASMAYTAVRRNPSGADWTTDYPDADMNW
jgi:hypothetical protein